MKTGWLITLGLIALSQNSPGAPFTLESFQNFIQTQSATSVDEVVEAVAKHHEEFRKNIVLVHDSRSIQEATPLQPRVITFSDDAKFIFAFGGHSKLEGGSQIEMIQFDDLTRSFRFQRIDFRHQPPRVSAVNDKSCLGCHRKDPRPNWEPYNKWPGTYGSTDRPVRRIRLFPTEEEDTNFDNFVRQNLGVGRYAFIENLDKLYTPNYHGYNNNRSPNLEFNQKVGFLNHHRIARLVEDSPDYDRYKFAILGALYDCDDIESYLPPSEKANLSHTYEKWATQTHDLFYMKGKNWLNQDDAPYIAKLRYLFEGREISMRDWYMSFRGEPYNFTLPNGAPMGSIVATLLIDRDSTLEPHRLHRINPRGGDLGPSTTMTYEWMKPFKDARLRICQQLATLSLESFGTGQ